MKRMMIAIAITACLATAGCGGGGGGGDSRTDREICQGYCSFSCNKAVNCLGGTSENALQCETECVATIDRNGGPNGNACSDTTEQIASLTCRELLTFLGLVKSTKPWTDATIGEHCALSVGK